MSIVAGGGDLGIVGETIAHPKPADSTMAGPMSAAPDSRALFPVEDGHEEQVSSQALKMDTGSGDNTLRPEKFTEGEMNEEEEDVVEECNRKGVNNDQPFKFSAELRCSPLKPFERKVSKVKVPSSSGVVRNLFFRGAGSASSLSSRQKQGDQGEDLVPPRVDAHDGFESAKKEGDTQIDEQLAGYAEKMKVGETEVQKVSLPGREGASHKRGPEIRLDGVEDTTSLPSCEMIPAIKTISQQASYGDELSEDCSGEDRREPQTQGATKKSGRVMQALLEYQQMVEESSKSVFESGVSSRALKRARKTEGVVTGKEKEATSPGAAGQLTGPMVGSRQEQ
ncbi:hypothetical protein OsJ_22665 [Oryza sativa Japonica Group]|uniref:Uncharacterized protein n=1 Tax=Oryza sativa subsp. japonica TaxID=39947 RepID=B9FQX0_ORYSJ|nr:hypothetical protein OsJ_22665 [Oryza sativa Japonica Group]